MGDSGTRTNRDRPFVVEFVILINDGSPGFRSILVFPLYLISILRLFHFPRPFFIVSLFFAGAKDQRDSSSLLSGTKYKMNRRLFIFLLFSFFILSVCPFLILFFFFLSLNQREKRRRSFDPYDPCPSLFAFNTDSQ